MFSDEAPTIIAAVEGGGTTFVVAVAELVGTQTPTILHRFEVDSSHDDPQQTLAACADFFQNHKPNGGYHALGIASFGPVGVNEANTSTYGCILGTSPKAKWRNVNLLDPLRKACEGSARTLQVKIDTDVNAPALAEFLLLKGDAISSLAYVTCGTGVGVGLVVHGKCVHGRMHPEAGHVSVQPLPNDPFEGYSWGTSKSPFRGVHTVEGIASSVALTERLQQQLQKTSESDEPQKQLNRNVLGDLPDDHDIWDHAANALANLCVTLLLTTSMEKIVLGGGVLKRRGLMEKIRTQTVELLNGYLELPTDMSTLICSAQYGDVVGLMGAIMLAKQSLGEAPKERGATAEEKTHFYHGMWHGMVIGVLATAGIGILATMNRQSIR